LIPRLRSSEQVGDLRVGPAVSTEGDISAGFVVNEAGVSIQTDNRVHAKVVRKGEPRVG